MEGNNELSSEERVIIDAIVGRDKKVFEMVYRRYYKQLFALALRYVEQNEVAEEIVHDTFLKIWKKAEELTVQYSLIGYLCKAVVNSSLNHIKKRKVEQAKQVSYLKVLPDQEAEDEETERQEKMLSELEKAMDVLPPKCKEVMLLSRFGKLKQQEIAEQLGISVKTVKNHLTYGFQKLRIELQKQQQTYLTLLILLHIYLQGQ